MVCFVNRIRCVPRVARTRPAETGGGNCWEAVYSLSTESAVMIRNFGRNIQFEPRGESELLSTLDEFCGRRFRAVGAKPA